MIGADRSHELALAHSNPRVFDATGGRPPVLPHPVPPHPVLPHPVLVRYELAVSAGA